MTTTEKSLVFLGLWAAWSGVALIALGLARLNDWRRWRRCMSARTIAEEVLRELRNRKGFGWWFEDLDVEVQEEIIDAVAAVVAEGVARDGAEEASGHAGAH